MKILYYTCDAGSLAIECGESIILIGNNWGDGEYSLFLFDEYSEWASHPHKKDFQFVNAHRFKDAKVLNYDCFDIGQTKCGFVEKKILTTLNGRWAFYTYHGAIFAVKWD